MNIIILYDTLTGTTHETAEVIAKELETLGHRVTLHRPSIHGRQPQLDGRDLIILGSPTYGDGQLEANMAMFTNSFSCDFSHQKVAVFGLGDRSYPQFCQATELLEAWVAKNHGTLVAPILKVDCFAKDVTPVTTWVRELVTK